MFPISDSAKTKSFPFVTLFLIALNIFVFLKELFLSGQSDHAINAFIQKYALVPHLVNLSDPYSLIPFFTAIFLHGGFLHIISNMWFLWIFGDNVESYFGKIKYLFLFIGAGLIGNLFQYLLNPNSTIAILGASGAISGILGAYYILFPKAQIKTILFIFLFFTVIDVPAVLYLFYWFFIQLFSGIASIGVSTQGGDVAFWAHVGGFISGIIAARSYKREREKNYIEGEIV